MPLILLTGYPGSGKTYRARQIAAYVQERIVAGADGGGTPPALTVATVADHALPVGRAAYATAAAEKTARARLAADVVRTLTPRTVVVADAPNYIKGFRYQLYCEARAARTPSCVVHVGTPIEQCRKVNEARMAAHADATAPHPNPAGGDPAQWPSDAREDAPWPPDVFENLIQRYEEPNGMTRWDSPLFTVPYEDRDPPYEAIWNAIVDAEGKARHAVPNAATVLPTARPEGSLSALERASQTVIDQIAAWWTDHPGEGGAEVSVHGVDDPVVLPMNGVTQPQLQRLRRQFVNMNRNHSGVMHKERIPEHFVTFLNDTWGTDGE